MVWLDFDPQVGREQAGRRPALVLSHAHYNERTGLAIVCPMTRQVKGYPFEVQMGEAGGGVVLVDQLKCVDWRQRMVGRKGRVSDRVMEEVINAVAELIA